MMHKKVRVTAKGKMRRAQAGTSHNTAKKAPHRIRKLRKSVAVDSANTRAAKVLMPYGRKHTR